LAASVGWAGTDPLAFRLVDVTCDASYPTGGYPLSATQLGLSKARGVIVTSHPSGYVIEFDAVNSKLKFYRTNTTGAALSEIPNATSLSGIVVHLLVYGDR
jgi:hypothetical protein